ncbi:hypothetical protein G4Z05_16205 [Bacillus thermocopriae]|jgi:hypothetical protein|uniref:Uncharacterized protein n=1 Tax=Neobacillus thermocopriae TaxID=1215031 RepID=A0A6B3TTI4_9BACI|nr:hypothetical protein [Neobacillus thermocopriae]MED3625588.1 hypothetical protein [Neobacillus thermocopriae]MED3715767.1 hypothetical protein [Neobacillus thermocopriae]NEX80354.1 hypothetical protein [Neobacillus thermocopriae]
MTLFWILLGFFGIVFVLYLITTAIGDGLMHAQGYSSQVLSMIHIAGIPNLQEGIDAHIGTKSDHLLINNTHRLSLDQVKRVQHLTEYQLVEKQKSVIKRAVVGGLLFGPLAAIVGGISGIGTKQTKEIQNFLSIDFIDKAGEEHTAVFLLSKISMEDITRFVKDVNEKVGYEEKIDVPTIKNPYEI